MKVRELGLGGMLLLERDVHTDARGSFDVVWNGAELAAAGIGAEFVQDNLIRTRRGTLRGMHFQTRHPQGKLFTVLGWLMRCLSEPRKFIPRYWSALPLIGMVARYRERSPVGREKSED